MRRPFTLLEVLIATLLTSVLLSVLFSSYYFAAKADSIAHDKQIENFRSLYTQTRLMQVFSTVVEEEKKPSIFYTEEADFAEGNTLVFLYDNGPGAGPDFSHKVIARLFVDDDNRLILATWPWVKRARDQGPPMRLEVLKENVDKLAFWFIPRPLHPELEVNIERDDSPKSYWSQGKLPIITEVILNDTKYTFVIPSKEHPIEL